MNETMVQNDMIGRAKTLKEVLAGLEILYIDPSKSGKVIVSVYDPIAGEIVMQSVGIDKYYAVQVFGHMDVYNTIIHKRYIEFMLCAVLADET